MRTRAHPDKTSYVACGSSVFKEKVKEDMKRKPLTFGNFVIKGKAMVGMMAAWELWEKALIPSLLSGSGTWFGRCQEAVDLCDDIQNFLWRLIIQVPESCPKITLKCKTRMLRLKCAWQEKIFFLQRIKKHQEGAMCKEIYEKEMAWAQPRSV